MKSNIANRLIFLVVFSSCALATKQNVELNPNQKILQSDKSQFTLTDKSGSFLVERESGRLGNQNKYAVKQQLTTSSNTEQVLEQIISISQIGRLNKLHILRPERSQYTVWFDGKKYFSELSIDAEKKLLVINLESPEKQWKGRTEKAFPTSTGVYCFYTQIVECASFTGFINKAIQEKIGIMNFYIIWDGYPYIMEQYDGIPLDVFSPARLEYDGKTSDNENRFLLQFGGETIFYMVNDNGKYDKQLWVSQGLSKVKRGIK